MITSAYGWLLLLPSNPRMRAFLQLVSDRYHQPPADRIAVLGFLSGELDMDAPVLWIKPCHVVVGFELQVPGVRDQELDGGHDQWGLASCRWTE